MSFSVTVTDTLLFYDQPLVVTAEGGDGRVLMGLSYGEDAPDDLQQFVFVQVDRLTMTEALRGQVDLLTALTERRTGLVFEGRAYGAPGEKVACQVLESVPAEALPKPGLFLPVYEAAAT
jgi:hypothetical protein